MFRNCYFYSRTSKPIHHSQKHHGSHRWLRFVFKIVFKISEHCYISKDYKKVSKIFDLWKEHSMHIFNEKFKDSMFINFISVWNIKPIYIVQLRSKVSANEEGVAL